MDLSLDEIIQQKKKKPGVGGIAKKFSFPRRENNPAFRQDARMKIIARNRSKIRDARENIERNMRLAGDSIARNMRIAGFDARQRIMQRRRRETTTIPANTHKPIIDKKLFADRMISLGGDMRGGGRIEIRSSKVGQNRKSPMRRDRPTGPLIDIPRGYIDYDNMERMEKEEFTKNSQLSFTVRNESKISRGDPLPPPAPRRLNSWGSNGASDSMFDPFDLYDMSSMRRDRDISLTDTLIPPPPPKLYEPRSAPHKYSDHLSYELRSRLERAPDPHASRGIFANQNKYSSSGGGGGVSSHQPGITSSSSGYRIVVSNLNTAVTTADIRELFGDLGPMNDARIVRPGVAEVIYKSLGDAERAVDTYHNRQLDKQPMKCMLVNPRATNKPTAPAAIRSTSYNSRQNSDGSPLEIDIDALHKVLFRRH